MLQTLGLEKARFGDVYVFLVVRKKPKPQETQGNTEEALSNGSDALGIHHGNTLLRSPLGNP